MKMQVLAKAKINLTLDVLYKRPDGYHEVEMVMQSLQVADLIELALREDDAIFLQVDRSDLPADESNLAYRAARLLQREHGVKRGVDMTLQKKIPMAAGLAGGSADAAAVLWGLNRLWDLNLPQSELERLGALLGSDIPFCLRGGTVLARGRGEELLELTAMPECAVVLVKLPIDVPTAWVYGQYQARADLRHPDTKAMLAAIEAKDLAAVAANVGNVLECVTIAAYPAIAEVKAELAKRGAKAVLMSGSGPTVFALAEDMAAAEALADGLAKRWQAEVIVTKTSKVGCEDGRTSFVAD
jgi:4-diphosphocytidyl-2-C-methyl-D-erythritol kinase